MNLDSERQAFEKWYVEKKGSNDDPLDVIFAYDDDSGEYCRLAVHSSWESWQARAALQAPQEPVLHVNKDDLAALSVRGFLRSANDCATPYFDVPLFANPPSPTPLTDKQIACVLESIADDDLIVLCPKTIIDAGRLLIAKLRGQP